MIKQQGNNMNTRKIAQQALNYLESLNKPLPPETDTAFYEQNREDYQALLKLNQKGLGASEADLKALVDAPLTEFEIKRIVKRMIKVDSLIFAEYDKREVIEKTPRYWNGFFSGYEVTPTARCEQLLNNSKARQDKLEDELSSLYKKITIEQAMNFGYCVDGMENEDFKMEVAA